MSLFLAGCLSVVPFLRAAGAPPVIRPSTSLNTQAVFLGQSASFTVTATGDTPLSYQWLRNGEELPGQTNRTLRFNSAQAADGGDYSTVVRNSSGAVTSYVARLHVVPPTSELVRSNHTNSARLRLPYLYHLPADYDPARRYPLILQFHGSGGIDETTVASYFPAQFYVHTSYARQAADPSLVVYPTRRVGNDSWTSEYIGQVGNLADELMSAFSIDTNRVYLVGTSEGVHAAWDLLGLRPGLFAAVAAAAGWKGNTPATSIKDTPMWVWHAADDPAVSVSNSRALVQALRQAGGEPIYTEFQVGGHPGGMGPGLMSPLIHNWLMAQRRGLMVLAGPRLSITKPASPALFTTSAAGVDLAGSAEPVGDPVIRVTWENLTTGTRGDALGTDSWSVAAVPLKGNATNVIVMTATTPSGFPVNGGTTTFGDTLAVVSLPIRLSLAFEGSEATLTWSGGVGPYRVQQATDLVLNDWQDIRTDAVSPVILGADGQTGFYRVVGQ